MSELLNHSPGTENYNTIKKTKKNEFEFCQVCGRSLHTFKRYYLIQSKEKYWISKEAREIFGNNMKILNFKKKVKKVRYKKLDK